MPFTKRKKKKRKKGEDIGPFSEDEIEDEVFYYDDNKEYKEDRDDSWDGMDY
ncbi:MAG: hypothetical protein ACTSQI_02655 [Candidatus Helarchaeota archaeon]